MDPIVVILIFVVVILLLIAFIVKMAKVAKKPQQDISNRAAQYGTGAYSRLSLVNGLPLAERTPCWAFVTADKLIIEAENQTFEVNLSQITAAQTKTETEIQQEVTSSAGKAIAGGLLLGPVGAIVGGRTKTKKTRTIDYYLIINYINQSGHTDVLAFDGQGSSKNCDVIAKPITEVIQSSRANTVTSL